VLAASLLLLVACPIGGISNTYSYLARAPEPESLHFSCTYGAAFSATASLEPSHDASGVPVRRRSQSPKFENRP
jgi:hypothetical protein